MCDPVGPSSPWRSSSPSAAAVAACGGGGGTDGGPGPGGAGQGLVLTSFLQAGQDNVPLNRILEFRFSEPVDPASVTPGSIQIRRGGAFGLTAQGTFTADGSVVRFFPRLPSLCDLSDAGFATDTTYRVQLMGYPEEFSVKNSKGQPLTTTVTYEFHTLPDTDPAYLEDQIPGAVPTILKASTDAFDWDVGDVPAVDVLDGNVLVLQVSENLDPCTVTANNITFHQYAVGDPAGAWVVPAGQPTAGNVTGFSSITDATPDDPYSWGSGTQLATPQQIPATIELQQDFTATTVLVRPVANRFEENSFLVVDVTRFVQDFGHLPLSPRTIPFTTENLPEQQGVLTVHFDANTPTDDAFTSADVNTARSPSRAQGWLIFAGDGDNGKLTPTPGAACDENGPSWPQAYWSNQYRENCLFRTVFAPDTDVTLNTGSTANWYPNETDGSTASVWEFASFTIVDGVTVRITGINPAILLVDGDVQIYEGGTLLLRGSNGTMGATNYSIPRGSAPTREAGGWGAGGGRGVRGAAVRQLELRPGRRHGLREQGLSRRPAREPGDQPGRGRPGWREHEVHELPVPSYNTKLGASQGGGGGAHGSPGAPGDSRRSGPDEPLGHGRPVRGQDPGSGREAVSHGRHEGRYPAAEEALRRLGGRRVRAQLVLVLRLLQRRRKRRGRGRGVRGRHLRREHRRRRADRRPGATGRTGPTSSPTWAAAAGAVGRAAGSGC